MKQSFTGWYLSPDAPIFAYFLSLSRKAAVAKAKESKDNGQIAPLPTDKEGENRAAWIEARESENLLLYISGKR